MTNLVTESAREALNALPRIKFGDLPTPVERMAGMGERLGLDLWVKRDDLSGTLYGGNKLRKLEFLLADALEKGHEEVWTVGAIGSHHVLATCIWARELGLDCAALQFPQPVTEHVLNNLRALSTTKPKLHLVGHRAKLPIEMFKVKLKEWLNANPDVYYIPGGGSAPLGVIGYVEAALELVEQFQVMDERLPDVVYVAAGTCGTMSGLTLGFALAQVDVRVVGVRVIDRFLANPSIASHLARKAADVLETAGAIHIPRLGNSSFAIEHGYFGSEYGVPTEAGLQAMHHVAESDGLKLEPTYTAKAFAGIEDQRAKLAGQRVLFWHTLSGADLSQRIEHANPERDLPAEYMDYFEER